MRTGAGRGPAPPRSLVHLVRHLGLVAVGQGAEPIHIDVAIRAEHHQHDGQSEPDLGSGDDDDEQGERLTTMLQVTKVRVEGDQVDVHRVQHQLDAHQHEHGVAAYEHAVDTDREQQAGEQQRPPQRHQRLRPRESVIAPTSAASNSTLSTSNGSTHILKIVAPVTSADPTTAWSRSISTPAKPATTVVPNKTATSNATNAAGSVRRTLRSGWYPVGALVSISAKRRSTTTAPT